MQKCSVPTVLWQVFPAAKIRKRSLSYNLFEISFRNGKGSHHTMMNDDDRF